MNKAWTRWKRGAESTSVAVSALQDGMRRDIIVRDVVSIDADRCSDLSAEHISSAYGQG